MHAEDEVSVDMLESVIMVSGLFLLRRASLLLFVHREAAASMAS